MMTTLSILNKMNRFQEGGGKGKAGIRPALFCEGYSVNTDY